MDTVQYWKTSAEYLGMFFSQFTCYFPGVFQSYQTKKVHKPDSRLTIKWTIIHLGMQLSNCKGIIIMFEILLGLLKQ